MVFSNNGISVKQGPHHVAQKFITITFPRCSSSLSSEPSSLVSVYFNGSLTPSLMFGWSIFASRSSRSLTKAS
jgi:hypothetical protein